MSAADEQLALLPAGARIAYNGLDTEASRYVINIGDCRAFYASSRSLTELLFGWHSYSTHV